MAYRGSQQGYNRQPPAMYQARHHQGYNNGYGYPHDYPSPWRFQPHYQAPPDRSVARSRPYSNHSTQQYNSSRPQHPTHSSQPSHTGNHHHQQQHQQQQQRQKRRADPQAVKKEQDRRDDLIALEKERRLLLSRTNPHIKHFEPYFNQAEAEILSQRQHGKFSHRQAGEIKRFSTAFIEKLGNQLGFPRRTIATAQTLYTRFHLFYPIKDFNPHDVAVVATFISAKMHDTLKKLHQVVAVSMHIRFPEKYKSPSIDDSVFETEKKRLLPIERLLLESISFSFKLKRPFDILIKLCRLLKVSKNFSKTCWKVLADSHRTLAPLLHSPHTLALSSIYLTSILVETDHQHQETSKQLIKKFEAYEASTWLSEYGTDLESIDSVVHFVLDLFIDESEVQHTNTKIELPDFIQTKIRLRENATKRESWPVTQDKRRRNSRDMVTSARSHIIDEGLLNTAAEQSTRYLFD